MDLKAIAGLVSEKRIRQVNPSLPRAEQLMAKAQNELAVAPKIIDASEEIAYTTAYEAMFKATLALLAVHGYRIGNIEQRRSAVQFCTAALPPGIDAVLAAYDKMRARRNDLSYDVGVAVSRTDAEEAIKQASVLVEAIGKEVAGAKMSKGGKKPQP